jgi:hypothetical protein
MAVIAFDFSRKERFGFFDDGTLNCLLPEIRAISEMQGQVHDYSKTGFRYVFNLYLTFGVGVKFGFASEGKCRSVRKDLITSLSNYWGPDKLLFVNGYDCEVVLVAAVIDVTQVFVKEHSALFSMVVDCVPGAVRLIFSDERAAQCCRRELLDSMERFRRQASIGNAKRMAFGR